MTNDELNKELAAIADADLMDRGDTGGKGIAYYGWFWRDVDWDQPIRLAYTKLPFGWVGFCENNKWGYPMVTCTPEQSAKIRALAEAIVSGPVHNMGRRMEALFDYMQALRATVKEPA